MHTILEIVNYQWNDSKNKEMRYTTKDGKVYIGKPFNVSSNELVAVEIEDGIHLEGMPIKIIKFVGSFPKKKDEPK